MRRAALVLINVNDFYYMVVATISNNHCYPNAKREAGGISFFFFFKLQGKLLGK